MAEAGAEFHEEPDVPGLKRCLFNKCRCEDLVSLKRWIVFEYFDWTADEDPSFWKVDNLKMLKKMLKNSDKRLVTLTYFGQMLLCLLAFSLACYACATGGTICKTTDRSVCEPPNFAIALTQVFTMLVSAVGMMYSFVDKCVRGKNIQKLMDVISDMKKQSGTLKKQEESGGAL